MIDYTFGVGTKYEGDILKIEQIIYSLVFPIRQSILYITKCGSDTGIQILPII